MTEPPAPPRGHMVLYDRMDPALTPGAYRIEVGTDVSLSGAELPDARRYFNVEGPRFRLPPTEVAGVFPPRNATGPFMDALPHITLGRRTLPWERTADPQGVLTLPAAGAGGPAQPTGKPPWLALLLFDDSEESQVEVVPDQPVSDVLPATVLQVLAPEQGARCDVLEVEKNLLRSLLPSLEELHLLCHVRQVNIEDRELSAGDSDGWFSVVVCARVPQSGRKYTACLVSLEGRTDLVAEEPPAVASGPGSVTGVVLQPGLAAGNVAPRAGVVLNAETDVRVRESFERSTELAVAALEPEIAVRARIDARAIPRFVPAPARLVLLHSWSFECEGAGTFQGLCEKLDVGMIGEVKGDWPKPTDTGHLPMEMRDRAGGLETVWYRGPLVPMPISRDTRGPYHTADQARRVSPETGLEDISYAAAFEVGRLLAAADSRLAQELMRWRRGDFRTSTKATLLDSLKLRFPDLLDKARMFDVAAKLVERWIDPRVRLTDPRELALIQNAPGLDPARMARAWGITEVRAREALRMDLAASPAQVDITEATQFGPATLETVLSDAAALGQLRDERLGVEAVGQLGLDGLRNFRAGLPGRSQ